MIDKMKVNYTQPELTKRELFALEAMKVILTKGKSDSRDVAFASVSIADELINELKTTKP